MFPCSPFFRLCAQGNPSSHIDRQPMATRNDSAAARYASGLLVAGRVRSGRALVLLEVSEADVRAEIDVLARLRVMGEIVPYVVHLEMLAKLGRPFDAIDALFLAQTAPCGSSSRIPAACWWCWARGSRTASRDSRGTHFGMMREHVTVAAA